MVRAVARAAPRARRCPRRSREGSPVASPPTPWRHWRDGSVGTAKATRVDDGRFLVPPRRQLGQFGRSRPRSKAHRLQLARSTPNRRQGYLPAGFRPPRHAPRTRSAGRIRHTGPKRRRAHHSCARVRLRIRDEGSSQPLGLHGDGGLGRSLICEPRRTRGRPVTDHLRSIGHQERCFCSTVSHLKCRIPECPALCSFRPAQPAGWSRRPYGAGLPARHARKRCTYAALDGQDPVHNRLTARVAVTSTPGTDLSVFKAAKLCRSGVDDVGTIGVRA